jgi:hypothetical protein
MTKNEGKNDRVIRAVVGIIFILLGATIFTGTLSIAMYVIGVISIITAATGFCGLYKLLGIDTTKE